MTELEKRLETLPTPTIIKIDDFEKHLAENIILAKEVLGTDWQPLEADPYMKKLRILTLRQLHNRADKNETIKQLLITTATGINLDHLGTQKDVLRDLGEKPRALVKFSLSREMPFDVIVPADTMLNNSQMVTVTELFTAKVTEDTVIKKGELDCTVSIELDAYIEQSDIKCEEIVTTIPYVAKAEQLSRFENGFALESDERYRYRIIKSNAKYSTAGCEDAYEFYTRMADSRIDDVVISASDGVVSIVVHSFSSTDQAMIERVTKSVNAKSVRPISDSPIVKIAEKIEVILDVNIELYDLTEQTITEQRIKANFDKSFHIGQDLVLSDVLRKCHLENVYRVNTSFTDVLANKEQVINIVEINLSFSGVDE
jgi:phage-related baseplate assembly protein